MRLFVSPFLVRVGAIAGPTIRRLYQSFGRLYQKQRYAAPRSANVPRSANASCAAIPSLYTRAKTVREARARAGETVKRRRLAARDGAPADASLPANASESNILGRVPRMPCFVGGNTQPTIPFRCKFPTPAKAAASTSSTCGCGATAGDRSARSRFWTPWRRGRRLFARRRRGPARRSSAGGWPLGTAPLRMRRRGSRRFASCFAPVRAACSRNRQCGFRNNLDALNAPAKITLVRRSLW